MKFFSDVLMLFFSLLPQQHWSGHEARLWLLSIVLALVADMRMLYQIAARELHLRVAYNTGGTAVDKPALVEEMRAQEVLSVQLKCVLVGKSPFHFSFHFSMYFLWE